MKRKFLPVNMPNEMVINNKRNINIITYEQLKQINNAAAVSSINISNQKRKDYSQMYNNTNKKQNGNNNKGRNTFSYTNQKKSNSLLSSSSSFNQSFCSNNNSNSNYTFPILNTDKANFRCAFSNMSKITNNNVIRNKINQQLKNKRSTYNCSAFPFNKVINIEGINHGNESNEGGEREKEEGKCTPKFYQQFSYAKKLFD